MSPSNSTVGVGCGAGAKELGVSPANSTTGVGCGAGAKELGVSPANSTAGLGSGSTPGVSEGVERLSRTKFEKGNLSYRRGSRWTSLKSLERLKQPRTWPGCVRNRDEPA